MKLKRMFETLRNCKEDRKKYYIEKKIKFVVDKEYLFSFFPTVIWGPWPWRYEYSYVIEIWWLNFNIGIGVWRKKK